MGLFLTDLTKASSQSTRSFWRAIEDDSLLAFRLFLNYSYVAMPSFRAKWYPSIFMTVRQLISSMGKSSA
jgi:hypothetical protein